MRAAPLLLVAALVGLLAAGARADTPAQCLYPDFEGPWKYYLGKNFYDNSIDCTNFKYPATEVVFNLTYPDVVVSGKDTGFWTRIYNQGAEIVINGYKYFAFSSYEVTSCEQNNCTYTSVCNTTFNGWYHDLQGNNWGCFFAVKQVPITGTPFQTSGPCNCSATTLGRPSTPFPQSVATAVDEQRWQSEAKMVSAINAAQLTWSAAAYPEYTQKTVRDMTRRAGGRLSRRLAASAPARPFDALLAAKSAAAPAQRPSHPRVAALPVAWDWTNVSGQNFVSPVRDQGDCGSCYAFSTMGMLEARIRLATRNTQRPVLSPQNIVSCSEYSQGCEGGFPYLVSKYGEDFQQVSEQCFPYANTTPTACTKRCNQSSQFFYDTNYYYVGGYFGACNEAAMMEELYYSGPVAVSFEVYQDFFGYKGGVYTHQNSTLYSALQMNPFEVTNHAVLLVGYGEDNGVPFWKVKNSWGTSWGEQGFFRILRGVNECAIEEMALAATPVGKKQH